MAQRWFSARPNLWKTNWNLCEPVLRGANCRSYANSRALPTSGLHNLFNANALLTSRAGEVARALETNWLLINARSLAALRVWFSDESSSTTHGGSDGAADKSYLALRLIASLFAVAITHKLSRKSRRIIQMHKATRNAGFFRPIAGASLRAATYPCSVAYDWTVGIRIILRGCGNFAKLTDKATECK